MTEPSERDREAELHAVLSDMVNCTEPLKCAWQKDAPTTDYVFCSSCGSGFDATMLHMAVRVVTVRAEGEAKGRREAIKECTIALRISTEALVALEHHTLPQHARVATAALEAIRALAMAQEK